MDLNKFDKIFVLVSGGFDSTYLYEKFKKLFGDKVYPVNCFNPFEISDTLEKISKDTNYIQIKPDKKYNYKDILREAFLSLPKGRELVKKKTYSKKSAFGCCYYIKHRGFLNNPIFKEENTVVISGIKRGDGKQRRIFLTQLRKGTFKSLKEKKGTFFLKHKTGELYCYPFRDYNKRELPNITKRRLWKKYPNLSHSGCEICPVLVLFDLKEEKVRYWKSIKYAKQLGVYP